VYAQFRYSTGGSFETSDSISLFLRRKNSIKRGLR
jgi:hypothetical protein